MRQTIRHFGTFVAILTLFLSTTGVAHASWSQEEVTDETPRTYTLSSAYPNPFNPTTTFSLTVNERQKVQVAIYNMLGQPVAALFEGTMDAGETRSFTFDAGDLPSGIYIYRVSGERFTAARQMTLIR